MTPPLLDPREILIAAIKDFLHAIKKYDLTGELLTPSLVQDLKDLALLPVSDPASAPDPVTDPVQEQRVLAAYTYERSAGTKGELTCDFARLKGGNT